MEIKKVIPLVYKYYRIKRRIKRLSSSLKETEREIEKLLSNKEDESYIIINGLKWDKENLSVGGTEYEGNHYYTFDEAQECTKRLGKRCPSQEELANLLKLGHTWDEDKKGIWVAGNHDGDHVGSLFFPAAGYRDGSDGGGLGGSPSGGYYWSSSPYASGNDDGGGMYFSSDGRVWPRSYDYRANGFSVRCVSELKK